MESSLPTFQEESEIDLLQASCEDDDFMLDWPDERELTEEEEEAARQDAHKVASLVKLVALDCDLTLLGIHTGGGYWHDSACELSKHLRPVFKIFVPELLLLGARVAVVTFSPQPQLIKEALEIGLQGVDASEVMVVGGHGVVVSGEDGCLAEVGTPPTTGRRRGKNHKQKHIASVMKHFREIGEDLSASDIFLVDDDPVNVQAAKEQGMKAARFDPDEPHRVFSEGCIEDMECISLRQTL